MELATDNPTELVSYRFSRVWKNKHKSQEGRVRGDLGALQRFWEGFLEEVTFNLRSRGCVRLSGVKGMVRG